MKGGGGRCGDGSNSWKKSDQGGIERKGFGVFVVKDGKEEIRPRWD